MMKPMTFNDLKLRLHGLEWNDIEFKEASGGIPQKIWRAVSAFSNTRGGWIVFGIRESDGRYTIQGIVNADEVQNGFIGTLRQRGKFSCGIAFQESLIDAEGQNVLTFYIPEVSRTEKPVHIDGDLGESYVRRGGTTQKCNRTELEAFLRDASNSHYEDEVIDSLAPATCFDADSLRWYRSLFSQKNSGHETEGASDIAFLEYFGLIVAHEGIPRPTRAAILLFGTAAACHRSFSRQQVDFFRFLTNKDDCLPETRWDDRIETLSEGNLIRSWRRIIEYFREKFHSGGRFELDATTMERTGSPPDYLAFREALLNLLIHQDYGDQRRKATIHAYTDTFEFWNPGSSFVCGDEYFQAGDKPVRNPKLRNMLTRIGIGEQANTGIKNIYSCQRSLGRVAPVIENDPATHSFRLVLSKDARVSPRQMALLNRLGVRLTDSQSAIFLHCWTRNSISLLEAQAVAGISIAETSRDLAHLKSQVLIENTELPSGHSQYRVLDHLRESHPVDILVPIIPGEVAGQVAGQVHHWISKVIRAAADSPLKSSEIQRITGIKHRETFQRNYLDHLLTEDWLARTIPAKPQSRLQKYRITEKSTQWLSVRNGMPL